MRKVKILLAVCLLLAVCMVSAAGCGLLGENKKTQEVPEPASNTIVAGEVKEAEQPAGREQRLALAASLRQLMEKDSAKYQVYVFFPQWDEPLVMGKDPQSSASIIKIFILGTAYELAEQGQLDLNQQVTVHPLDMVGGAGVINGQSGAPVYTVRKLLELMITESDNTATNVLMDAIGLERIHHFMKEHGFHDSILQRKMMDYEALRAGKDNFTTAADAGRFFRLLREHKLVGEAADSEMISILFGQTDTECFPQALPQARIAHKTGELSGVYHDAGIVYDANDSYVLCIMSTDSRGRGNTLSTMRNMAKTVDLAFHQ
ncbi:serine hydrolase [Selenomonas ruminis]|uniref:Serine hydrolase n=1 Tax=Selenomonas ruminis TaxID=2593411 RepID=A0A5D6WAB0_9FIRM|nr:serine hydrolase [Selenomonas sp. mPRGC5]TYZ23925.1 serine hydrolase [Selenomonas sp. mPRGC5]